MPRVVDLIRKSLESKIRPDPRATLNENPALGDRPSLSELRAGQWVPQFETYMRNRLIVGACRYETFKEKKLNNSYKIIESIAIFFPIPLVSTKNLIPVFLY